MNGHRLSAPLSLTTRWGCFTRLQPTPNPPCMRWKFFLFPRSVIWHPKDSKQKDGPLTPLEGRKEGAVIQRAQTRGIEQKRNVCAQQTSPWLRQRRRAGSPKKEKKKENPTGRPPQMISKRQVSLSTGGWVTFHGALWGGDDEEFQQQSPSQQQPDSQSHQRAKQQKVQLTLYYTVAIFPARLWFLHGYAVPLLFRLPFLPAERRTP